MASQKRGEWFYPKITKLREIQPSDEDEAMLRNERRRILPRQLVDEPEDVDMDSDLDSEPDDEQEELAKAHSSIFGEIDDSDEDSED